MFNPVLRIALLAPCALLIMAAALGQSSEVLSTQAVVTAPAEDVWKAFTTKEGIESWMVAKTDFTLAVGALWRTSYSKDSNLDDDRSIHHRILAYDPGRLLAFRTVKTPKGFAWTAALEKTWTVVYFEALSADTTRVTTRMLGYTQDEESQRMRAFFERGNQQEMDSLVKRFEKKQ